MAGKKKATGSNLPTIKIGGSVRRADDGAEGRITWASGTHVKIKWDDGEQVTWKRDSLAGRPIEILGAAGEDDEPAAPAAAATADQTTTAEVPQAKPGSVATRRTAPAAKPKRQRKAPPAPKEKKLSALDAAARVLGQAGRPMNCQEMIDAMAAKGYWTSPGGKTPAATLYSAVLRELANKGADARFVKTDRGKFGLKS